MADWPDQDKHNQESIANYNSYIRQYEPKELNIKKQNYTFIYAISITIISFSLIIAGFIIFAGFVQIKFNQNFLERNLN